MYGKLSFTPQQGVLMRKNQQQLPTDPSAKTNNDESVEINDDALKAVTGGITQAPKLPGMNKTPDITLKRG